jgi:hypothetical protein
VANSRHSRFCDGFPPYPHADVPSNRYPTRGRSYVTGSVAALSRINVRNGSSLRRRSAANRHRFGAADEVPNVQPVETTDPEGVDYGWVMQTTFVLTILVGAPIVAVLSLGTPLPTWAARVEFAVRVGAVVWVVVALAVFGYAWRFDAGDGGRDSD